MKPQEKPLPRRKSLLVEAMLVGLVVFGTMWWQIHDFALAWDEGATFDRIEKLELGWAAWRDGGDFASVVDRYWRFSRAEPDGHGPMYALVSASGNWLSGNLLPPPASYRVGTALLFTLTCVAIYVTLRRHGGLVSSMTGVALLASTPRIVPEVTYSCVDGTLFSFAMLAWCAFESNRQRPSLGRSALFGLMLGLAMGTKLTGWFLPTPYVLATLIDRPRGSWPLLTWSLLVALATVVGINLGWWPAPLQGFVQYLESNLTRKETIPIASLFLGTRYPFSLPWYNTVVWTVLAEPVGILLLGCLGAAFAWKSSFGRVLLLNWLLLLILRAMPEAPGHDGTRQIIISFGFLSLLGAHAIERLDRMGGWKSALALVLSLSAVTESVSSTLLYRPLDLSYYSPLVGGLPGATKLGMEPTYFWDSLTPEVLDWINTHTRPDESVRFSHYPLSLKYLREWGRLEPEILPGPSRIKWYVLQHRPGIYDEVQSRLAEVGVPAFRKSLFDVPVLSIYPYEEWISARQDVDAERTP